jgi:hypothetical protein
MKILLFPQSDACSSVMHLEKRSGIGTQPHGADRRGGNIASEVCYRERQPEDDMSHRWWCRVATAAAGCRQAVLLGPCEELE